VIETVFPLLQAGAFRRGSRLQMQLAEIPEVFADEKEIRQCLLNLVQNGLDAVPDGGVVTVSTRFNADQVIMAVHNEGPEMPAYVREKLCTPFFTTKDKGTGLGVPVCYSIADRHNARIDVASRPWGTTFPSFSVRRTVRTNRNRILKPRFKTGASLLVMFPEKVRVPFCVAQPACGR